MLAKKKKKVAEAALVRLPHHLALCAKGFEVIRDKTLEKPITRIILWGDFLQ